MPSSARIDELKKKFDDNPRRYFAPLANEFRKAGDIEQAILICEEFLPQQPGHMSGHIVYGQALYEAGKMPESRTVFETALSLDPENLIALRHLGDIARGQDDLPAARGWYARVLDADPRNEEIQTLLASLGGDADNADSVGSVGSVGDAGSAQEPVASSLDDPSLHDTLPAGMPAIPAWKPPEARDSTSRDDVSAGFLDVPTEPMEAFTLKGLEATSDASSHAFSDAFSVVGEHEPTRAEGFESAEFSVPDEPVPTSMDLDASLESGVPTFDSPGGDIAPLDGMEETAMSSHGGPDSMPDVDLLEIDGGLIPLADETPAASPPGANLSLEEFSLDEPPTELPPAVIAAEAMLIDAGETPAPAPAPEMGLEFEEGSAPASAPFVTETMADLYLAQGFREEALAVYRQLLDANPSDDRLRARVELLAIPVPVEEGPSVREYLARFAARRPGSPAAVAVPPAEDDFAAFESESTPTPIAADLAEPSLNEATLPTGEETAVPERAGGTLDALFGNRAATTSEDSAASALAQAFGSTSEAPAVIGGRPARAAAGELSLDSVFRDGSGRPPRTSQSFSFDQFFSESVGASGARSESPVAAEATAEGDKPAERSAGDIEQFNSWLQGLKQR